MKNKNIIDSIDSLFSTIFVDSLFNDNSTSTTYNRFQNEFIRKEDYYIFHLALPGLTKLDLNLSIKDNLLLINSQHKKCDDCPNFVGEFEKKYIIPEDVDQTKIDALVENGVLTVKLPKIKKIKDYEDFKIKIK
jgi:HSP20 family protein